MARDPDKRGPDKRGLTVIQGSQRVLKNSKIKIERALNSDKPLGRNVADWLFPGQRDRPRSQLSYGK